MCDTTLAHNMLLSSSKGPSLNIRRRKADRSAKAKMQRSLNMCVCVCACVCVFVCWCALCWEIIRWRKADHGAKAKMRPHALAHRGGLVCLQLAAFLDQFVIHVKGGEGCHQGFTGGGAGHKPVTKKVLVVWFVCSCFFGPVSDPCEGGCHLGFTGGGAQTCHIAGCRKGVWLLCSCLFGPVLIHVREVVT